MLIRPSSVLELVSISKAVIFGATVIISLLFLFIIGTGIKAQRRKTVTGQSALIGIIGEVTETLSPAGTVLVNGELWNSESIAGTIATGQKVRITSVKNLKIYVEPITQS